MFQSQKPIKNKNLEDRLIKNDQWMSYGLRNCEF